MEVTRSPTPRHCIPPSSRALMQYAYFLSGQTVTPVWRAHHFNQVRTIIISLLYNIIPGSDQCAGGGKSLVFLLFFCSLRLLQWALLRVPLIPQSCIALPVCVALYFFMCRWDSGK